MSEAGVIYGHKSRSYCSNMGASQSKQSAPSAASIAQENVVAPAITNNKDTTSTNESSSKEQQSSSGGGCPMKNMDGSYRIMPGFASLFGKMAGHPPVDVNKIKVANDSQDVSTSTANTTVENGNTITSASTVQQSSGCPVKNGSSSSSSWNILRRGAALSSSSEVESTQQQQQYDVYSRPLPMDPTNNMPIVNPTNVARNSLPAPGQNVALPTERVVSTIPKVAGGDEKTTWTYPSPQMFYNALARKGKLDEDTKEEDMISVVAIHNCMNEGTWGRILQWEKVLNPAKEGDESGEGNASGPSLTKFMGRPTDLSPKAAFKHYILNHPLPFDRHDWTVTRSHPDGSVEDVRYVIDYYHDDKAAQEEEGSGLPQMNEGIGSGGKIQSLLVDVRPAADSVSEVWGRMVTMPLARRGCRSILECVLFKGEGNARDKSDFEPLPLSPNDSLKESLSESKQVWDNIQKDAANQRGVGAKDGGKKACASDSLEDEKKVENVSSAAEQGRKAVDIIVDEEKFSKSEATKVANTFSQILSQCQDTRTALANCNSDEECQKAFMGMTVCAGQYMCPLQHTSLLNALESHGSADNEEMAEAKINTALDVLGECVANYDSRASGAKKQYPDVFEDVLKKNKK